MFISKNKTWLLITNWLVLALFAFNSAGYGQPPSAPMSSPGSHFYLPGNFSIPAQWGTIDEVTVFNKSDKPFIIYIQDAHGLTDAQKSIAQIIEYCQKEYGIQHVAVEGAEGNLDPFLLRHFPNQRIRQKVMDDYLLKGELTGAEYAIINSSKPLKAFGMEDWALYELNYQAYLRSVKNKSVALEKLQNIRMNLDKERSSIFSQELNQYFEKLLAFKDEKLSLDELLGVLKEFWSVDELKEKYPHLAVLFKVVNQPKNSHDSTRAIKKWSHQFQTKQLQRLTIEQQREFNSKRQDHQTGRIDDISYLDYLVKTGQQLLIKPKLIRQMRNELEQIGTLETIRGGVVFEELESLMIQTQKRISKTPAEKELIEKYDYWELLKSLVRLEAPLSKYQKIKQQIPSVIKLWDETGSDVEGPLEFYEKALERDLVFHEKITKFSEKESAEAVIVLAGGFHRKGFEKWFENEKISHVVISPRMNSLEGKDNYERVMTQDVSYKKYLHGSFYQAFHKHASEKLVQSLDQLAFRQTLKLWRDKVIQDLAWQGKTENASSYTCFIDDLFKVYFDKYGASDFKAIDESWARSIIEKELDRFRHQAISNLWAEFQNKFRLFEHELKQLVDRNSVNETNVQELLNQFSQPGVKALSAPLVLGHTKRPPPVSEVVPSQNRSELRVSEVSPQKARESRIKEKDIGKLIADWKNPEMLRNGILGDPQFILGVFDEFSTKVYGYARPLIGSESGALVLHEDQLPVMVIADNHARLDILLAMLNSKMTIREQKISALDALKQGLLRIQFNGDLIHPTEDLTNRKKHLDSFAGFVLAVYLKDLYPNLVDINIGNHENSFLFVDSTLRAMQVRRTDPITHEAIVVDNYFIQGVKSHFVKLKVVLFGREVTGAVLALKIFNAYREVVGKLAVESVNLGPTGDDGLVAVHAMPADITSPVDLVSMLSSEKIEKENGPLLLRSGGEYWRSIWGRLHIPSESKLRELSPEALQQKVNNDLANYRKSLDKHLELTEAKWIVTGHTTPLMLKKFAQQLLVKLTSANTSDSQKKVKQLSLLSGVFFPGLESIDDHPLFAVIPTEKGIQIVSDASLPDPKRNTIGFVYWDPKSNNGIPELNVLNLNTGESTPLPNGWVDAARSFLNTEPPEPQQRSEIRHLVPKTSVFKHVLEMTDERSPFEEAVFQLLRRTAKRAVLRLYGVGMEPEDITRKTEELADKPTFTLRLKYFWLRMTFSFFEAARSFFEMLEEKLHSLLFVLRSSKKRFAEKLNNLLEKTVFNVWRKWSHWLLMPVIRKMLPDKNMAQILSITPQLLGQDFFWKKTNLNFLERIMGRRIWAIAREQVREDGTRDTEYYKAVAKEIKDYSQSPSVFMVLLAAANYFLNLPGSIKRWITKKNKHLENIVWNGGAGEKSQYPRTDRPKMDKASLNLKNDSINKEIKQAVAKFARESFKELSTKEIDEIGSSPDWEEIVKWIESAGTVDRSEGVVFYVREHANGDLKIDLDDSSHSTFVRLLPPSFAAHDPLSNQQKQLVVFGLKLLELFRQKFNLRFQFVTGRSITSREFLQIFPLSELQEAATKINTQEQITRENLLGFSLRMHEIVSSKTPKLLELVNARLGTIESEQFNEEQLHSIVLQMLEEPFAFGGQNHFKRIDGVTPARSVAAIPKSGQTKTSIRGAYHNGISAWRIIKNLQISEQTPQDVKKRLPEVAGLIINTVPAEDPEKFAIVVYEDLGEGSTLFDLAPSLSSVEKLEYLLEAAKVCRFLNDQSIIHRDIKPSNFFIQMLPDGKRKLVIIDFGFAIQIPDIPTQSEQDQATNQERVDFENKNVFSPGTTKYLPEEHQWDIIRHDFRRDPLAFAVTAATLLDPRLDPIIHLKKREEHFIAPSSIIKQNLASEQKIDPVLKDFVLKWVKTSLRELPKGSSPGNVDRIWEEMINDLNKLLAIYQEQNNSEPKKRSELRRASIKKPVFNFSNVSAGKIVNNIADRKSYQAFMKRLEQDARVNLTQIDLELKAYLADAANVLLDLEPQQLKNWANSFEIIDLLRRFPVKNSHLEQEVENLMKSLIYRVYLYRVGADSPGNAMAASVSEMPALVFEEKASQVWQDVLNSKQFSQWENRYSPLLNGKAPKSLLAESKEFKSMVLDLQLFDLSTPAKWVQFKSFLSRLNKSYERVILAFPKNSQNLNLKDLLLPGVSLRQYEEGRKPIVVGQLGAQFNGAFFLINPEMPVVVSEQFQGNGISATPDDVSDYLNNFDQMLETMEFVSGLVKIPYFGNLFKKTNSPFPILTREGKEALGSLASLIAQITNSRATAVAA